MLVPVYKWMTDCRMQKVNGINANAARPVLVKTEGVTHTFDALFDVSDYNVGILNLLAQRVRPE